MCRRTVNAPFSETTRVARYQTGKTNLDFTEARDSEWQWHQLGRMQVCTSLQTDNHASTPPLSFTGRMPFLPPNQQHQSTEGRTTRQIHEYPQIDRHIYGRTYAYMGSNIYLFISFFFIIVSSFTLKFRKAEERT